MNFDRIPIFRDDPNALFLADENFKRIEQLLIAAGGGLGGSLGFFYTGMTIMWYGAAADCPSGWAICDGTNGTPDMRDRVAIGAGSTYALDATGGTATVTLTEANLASHDHDHNHDHQGGVTVGEAVHTHAINIASGGQSANHTHAVQLEYTGAAGHTHAVGIANPAEGPSGGGVGLVHITAGVSVDHTHTTNGTSASGSTHAHVILNENTPTATAGSGTAHNNLQPYRALHFIMKL